MMWRQWTMPPWSSTHVWMKPRLRSSRSPKISRLLSGWWSSAEPIRAWIGCECYFIQDNYYIGLIEFVEKHVYLQLSYCHPTFFQIASTDGEDVQWDVSQRQVNVEMLFYKTLGAILFQTVNIVLFPPATSSSNSGAKVKEFFYCRVSLLELVFAQMETSGPDECGVAPGVARFLADCFQNSCGAVLKLSADACASDDEVWRAGQPIYFSSVPPLRPLIHLFQFPLDPAGGADGDRALKCALWDDLRQPAISVSAGSS